MSGSLQLIILFAAALFPRILVAQQVQWLTASPNDWILNPTTPVDVLCARDPDHVYVAKLDHIAYTYNEPMGTVTLSRQVADGSTLWTVSLGDSVQVESIASDDNGTLVLGGRYFKRLLVDGTPVLTAAPGQLGSFLCSWDANGQLLWQSDVTGGPFDDVSVASLALDPQGRFWAALSTFFSADIVRLETDGSQVESRSLVDSKMIGSISFDPWGGLYVAGAAESPDITINGTVFPVTESYAFFVTRMNAAGDPQWLRYAHDITFQRPRVQADPNGGAYLAGTYFQSLTWGTIPFADPLWSTGFFLTRLDSLGTFEWGVEPSYAPGSGLFTLARGNALGVDNDGHAYVLGNMNGSLDWGNGVVTGSGTIIDKSVALLRFDETGLPVWGLGGGSTFSDVMYDLAVATDGISHVVGITSDPFTLGTYTVDPLNARASVVARIDPGLSTSVVEATGTTDLTACPSVFNSTFRLVSTTVPDEASTTVTLLDVAGRVVERGKGLGAEFGKVLANGSYTVLVHAKGCSSRTRVVKE